MIAWWFYFVAIPAATLLANGIPHFIQGISGRRFPTPFSGGPGTEDTAVSNVVWGSTNLIAGGVLLWTIREGLSHPLLVLELLVVGVAVASLLAYAFSHPARFGWRR